MGIPYLISCVELTRLFLPQDPKSVHVSWSAYFNGLDKGLPSSQAFTPPPGVSGGLASAGGIPAAADGAPSMSLSGDSDQLTDHLKVGRSRVTSYAFI